MLPLEETLTIGQMLHQTAERFPDRPALEYQKNIWTYQTFNQEVSRLARRLLALGIRKGSHVGLWCEAEPNAVLLLYATARIGAVTIMFNTSLTKHELTALLERTDAQYLAIGDGYKELVYPELCQGLTAELPELKEVLCIGRQNRGNGYTSLDGELADEMTLKVT